MGNRKGLFRFGDQNLEGEGRGTGVTESLGEEKRDAEMEGIKESSI